MVPAIHADTGGPNAVIVAGASIGAFNALALVCRYPDLFRAAVCMSGTYDIERFIGGFTDDLFFSSPMHFLPGLEGPALDALRQRFVVLASGSGKWEDIGESWRAAEVLGEQGRAQPRRRLGPGRTTTTGRRGGRCCPEYLEQLTREEPSSAAAACSRTWPGWSPCRSVARRRARRGLLGRPPTWWSQLFAGAGVDDVRRVPTDDGSDAVVGFIARSRGCADGAALLPLRRAAGRPRRRGRSSPWELTERDGRLYGRGAADCKGNLVMLLTALRALPRPWPVGVRVVCEGSEEMSTGGLSRLVGADAGAVRGRRDARSPTPATSSSARRP